MAPFIWSKISFLEHPRFLGIQITDQLILTLPGTSDIML